MMLMKYLLIISTYLLVWVVPECSALFKHKVRIVACVEKLASGRIRMWDEPWEGAPSSDESWDTYYGGSVRSIGRGKTWSKTWTSEIDLFDATTNSTTSGGGVHPEAFLFQDLVLGGEEDEVCISDIRAETQQSDGKYKVRWRFLEDFWLAGQGSDYYQKNRIKGAPCYTEIQLGGCAVTFARDKEGGVEHFVKSLSSCKDGLPLSNEDDGIDPRAEVFPRRRLGAPVLAREDSITHEF